MQWFQTLMLSAFALMHRVWRWCRSATYVRRRQAAQGLVEYALILVLIAIVVIGSLTAVGKRVSNVYRDVDCGLSGATSKGGSSNSVNACNSTNPGNGG